jgi:alcohol dehydrogenase class IV
MDDLLRTFTLQTPPSRVVFGRASIGKITEEVDRLSLRRLMILSTPEQTDLAHRVAGLLGHRAAVQFCFAAMHTPADVTLQAMVQVEQFAIDGVVSIGGGSTTGLGKAIAWRTDLPQIVLPTTYAGSEMTPILGETADGAKVTRRSPRIQPETVIYDVDLTLSLPVAASMTSGLNAIAHAAEALYAPDANPITALLAEDGVRALARALPAIQEDPRSAAGREDALYGAWLCGTCLGQVAMGLHHKLCHTLGGAFNLPHAATHGIVLPHAIAYNQRAAPAAMRRLAAALGVDAEPALALHRLAVRLGAPIALRQIGMPEEGITRAAELACATPYPNPRPIERPAMEALLRAAWAGQPPAA